MDVELAPVEVVAVFVNPNVGTDVLGALVPKTKAFVPELMADVVTATEGAVFFAVVPNENIGLLESSVLVELVLTFPNEIVFEIDADVTDVAVAVVVLGLPKLNIAGIELVLTAVLVCNAGADISVFANGFVPNVGGVNVGNVALLIAFD